MLSALSAIFCKAFQQVTRSNHKLRNFSVAVTPFFFGQGINYRTVANQFGIAEPTVCRIVHKKAKAIVDNLTPNASNSLKVTPNFSMPW